MTHEKRQNIRWLYLALGSAALLLGGIIYSWSILKSPLAEEFGWNPAQLALNFTITICFFGIGGLVSGILAKRLSPRTRLFISAVMVFLGYFLASRVTAGSLGLLYSSYGVLAGLSIGILYNTTIATIGEWFPDRKGLSSGIMLMCFGFSTLLFGGLAGRLMAMPDFGWRKTYLLLGCCMAGITILFGLVIKRPEAEKTPAGSPPLAPPSVTPARPIVILIGPEGDFSRAEASLALECGFRPIHLGESRLRTETAALTAVEAVYFHYM